MVSHRNNLLYFDLSYEDRIDEVVQLVNYLRKSIPRQILIILSTITDEFISLKQIATTIGKTSSGIHWHIQRMIEDSIVYPIRRGKQVSLKLYNPQIVKILGSEIFPSRWDHFLDNIVDKFSR